MTQNFDPVALVLQKLEAEFSDPRYFSEHHITDPDVEKLLRLWLKFKEQAGRSENKDTGAEADSAFKQKELLIKRLIEKIEALA